MKLTELLTEGPLDAFLGNRAAPRLNAQSGTEAQIIALKDALRKHTIVTGQLANGQFQTAGPAWAGDSTGEWSQALGDAIIAWKRSINLQLGENRLDNTGEVGHQDLQILVYSKLYDTGSKRGLLRLGRDREEEQQGERGLPWSGERFSYDAIPDTPVTEITDTKSFVNAIGFSGWVAIVTELARVRNLEGTTMADFISRSLRYINSAFQEYPDRWLTQYRTLVVTQAFANESATLDNGKTMKFLPNVGGVNSANGAKELYRYFRDMAAGLLRKGRAEEDEKTRANPGSDDQVNTAITLSEDSITRWVVRMHNALEFDFIAFLPFGRAPDDDVEAISSLMGQINSAGDWDRVVAKFNDEYQQNLNFRLADELNDEDYDRFVRRNLFRIRRIMPTILHSAINWGNDQESLDVSVDSETYQVKKKLESGKVVVVGGRNRNVKDAILEDTILKTAITQTGGNIPDMNIEVTSENLRDAGFVVIAGIEQAAPEMVAWYTAQNPFDESRAAQLGPRRLAGIREEMARLLANGMSNTSAMSWVANEVNRDREWLIGDGTDENPGAANVHFDRRYLEEGDPTRNGEFGSNDTDEHEITDEEQELIDRLTGTEEEQQGVIAEIANEPNHIEVWSSTYRGFEKSERETWDTTIGDVDEFIKIAKEGADRNGSLLEQAIGNFGLVYGAPNLMAQAFEKSMENSILALIPGGRGPGGDNETLDILVAAIDNKTEYDLVNEYFRQISGVTDDLIDELAGEELFNSMYNNLAEKIGGESAVDLRTSGLTSSVVRRLERAAEDPSPENLNAILRALSSKEILDKESITAIVDALDNIVQEFGATFDDEQREEIASIQERLEEIKDIIDDEGWWDYIWRKAGGWFD